LSGSLPSAGRVREGDFCASIKADVTDDELFKNVLAAGMRVDMRARFLPSPALPAEGRGHEGSFGWRAEGERPGRMLSGVETQHLASVYQRKLAALDELKKFLLHQAFTGQL
jgi:hypothetical protein